MDKHTVIVGAGIAGLTAAYHLPEDVTITVVEASDSVGGRIRAGSLGELGAEYIHGTSTVLTTLIEELQLLSRASYEPIFVTSHADGGPDKSPTFQGKYGMYYFGGELRKSDDAEVVRLSDALESALAQTHENMSMGEALKNLPESLQKLAQASYSNTAACSDLFKLSLPILRHFEHHWETAEVEGDVRLSTGMSSVVGALVKKLKNRSNFSVVLNSKVSAIFEENDKVHIRVTPNDLITADTVICTASPPLVLEIDMNLPPTKIDAFRRIGFEGCVKILVEFKIRLWPEHLQSVVCGDDMLLPEIWFQSHSKESHIMTGFVTSDMADRFQQERSKNDQCPSTGAASLAIQQLAKVLSIDEDHVRKYYADIEVFDWKKHETVKGGYMYPTVGLTVDHLHEIAAPHGRILFAGEATNTNACCTVQAAMETAIRASKQALDILSRDPLTL